MRVEARALCRFIAYCWCRNRGVDEPVRVVRRRSEEEEEDHFADNPTGLLDEKESRFKELIEGYIYINQQGQDGTGVLVEESVDMTGPRRCSYQKYDRNDNEYRTIHIGKEVPRKTSANKRASYQYTPMPVKMRGITLRQLRAVYANIVERCEKEGWVNHKGQRLTPETVTLYDVNKYIVKPFTKDSQASFVETLPSTCGTQDPRWFVSHWWGEAFVHTLACLEQFVKDFRWNVSEESGNARGGGMTIDTPIWLCIFANNQWKLEDFISTDPNLSSFNFALTGPAENRVISILDSEGIVFTRIWCDFELHLTFTAQMKDSDENSRRRGLWVVYTAHKHTNDDGDDREAVGIISGGAPGEGAYATSKRESYFPTKLIQKSSTINIESAEASEDSDRTHILNSIVRNKDLGADPPKTHPNYDHINDAVKGAFAASMPVLKAAANTGGDEWKDTLIRMSKGVRTGTFTLDFSEFEPRLSSSQARELVCHIPVTCDGLNFWNGEGEEFEGGIEGMVEWMGKARNLKSLVCTWCKVGNAESGKDAGMRLAGALEMSSSHHNHDHIGTDTGTRTTRTKQRIERIDIRNTDIVVSGNISQWASALNKMTSLRKVRFSGVGQYITNEEMRILGENITHASDVKIR